MIDNLMNSKRSILRRAGRAFFNLRKKKLQNNPKISNEYILLIKFVF